MPSPVVGAVGAGVAGSVVSSRAQASAAEDAAEAQQQSSDAAIAEQQRQFDTIVDLMKPYVEAGESSLAQQMGLIGLSGEAEQQQAIQALENSPQMQSMISQGESALLQNAAATGGLRGGNTQQALSQYRPQLLAQMIESQYGKLGGITALGQASAGGQAAAAQNTASNVGALLQQQGAAQAGAALASGQARGQLAGNIAGSIGTLAGMGVFGGF